MTQRRFDDVTAGEPLAPVHKAFSRSKFQPHTRSMTIAIPCPTPMHMVHSA